MKIDSIILVSKTEVEDFKKITHENNVFFFLMESVQIFTGRMGKIMIKSLF